MESFMLDRRFIRIFEKEKERRNLCMLKTHWETRFIVDRVYFGFAVTCEILQDLEGEGPRDWLIRLASESKKF